MIISLEDTVIQKEELDSVDMDGEVVMMDITKGKYYGFNDVGSAIWKLAQEPLKVSQIIFALLKQYNIDAETCEKEVLKFINDLYNEELIAVV